MFQGTKNSQKGIKEDFFTTEYQASYNKKRKSAKRNGSQFLKDHPEFHIPSLESLKNCPSDDCQKIPLRRGDPDREDKKVRTQDVWFGNVYPRIPGPQQYRRLE